MPDHRVAQRESGGGQPEGVDGGQVQPTHHLNYLPRTDDTPQLHLQSHPTLS